MDNLPNEVSPPADPAAKKFIERSMAEFDKKLEKFDDRICNLELSYGNQAKDLKELKNFSLKVRDLETKINTKAKTETKEKDKEIEIERPQLINYTVSSPKERRPSGSKQPSKIIINNNADKLETEKKIREMDRKIEDLKTDTFRKFDSTSEEFLKFKTSM
jgi:hypothetical protein